MIVCYSLSRGFKVDVPNVDLWNRSAPIADPSMIYELASSTFLVCPTDRYDSLTEVVDRLIIRAEQKALKLALRVHPNTM